MPITVVIIIPNGKTAKFSKIRRWVSKFNPVSGKTWPKKFQNGLILQGKKLKTQKVKPNSKFGTGGEPT
jgi:hypothetical protein